MQKVCKHSAVVCVRMCSGGGWGVSLVLNALVRLMHPRVYSVYQGVYESPAVASTYMCASVCVFCVCPGYI